MYSLPYTKYILGKEFYVIRKLTISNNKDIALIQEYTFEEKYRQWFSIKYINKESYKKYLNNENHLRELEEVFPLNNKPRTMNEIKKYIGVNNLWKN